MHVIVAAEERTNLACSKRGTCHPRWEAVMSNAEAVQWKAFARRFSREHDGWSASLQVREVDGAVETAVDDRPFRGITFEAPCGREALILTFGDDPDEHLAHWVEQPIELTAVDGEEGHCLLVIGRADGSGCVLDLESPFTVD
jgi:hypothetical protein